MLDLALILAAKLTFKLSCYLIWTTRRHSGKYTEHSTQVPAYLHLEQVHLAAGKKILSAVQAICNEKHHRRIATGLVIDILMYDELTGQDNTLLHAMYVAKQDLRKLGQKWSLSSAKLEHRQLFDNQERCITDRQGARFRDVSLNALKQLENVETISMTDRFCDWYYKEGPLSWDVKSVPFPACSTLYTLGCLTMALMNGLWQTRETRHPKTKSFVADIFGDPNGQENTAGLPYDAMFWGVRSLIKKDNSVFRGVFNGFERLPIDISHRRHFKGYGEHIQTMARAVKPRQKREEWLGIGKMMAGAENLSSLNLRLRNDVLEQGHFDALLGHLRWINLISLRLFNVHASAENLTRVLEDYTDLKTLALMRIGVSGDLQTIGVAGPLAYSIDDLPVGGDSAGRVAAVLTLKSVALFCLMEVGEHLITSEFRCRRWPLCRYTGVENAILSGRTNEWSEQGEYQLQEDMTMCDEDDQDDLA